MTCSGPIPLWAATSSSAADGTDKTASELGDCYRGHHPSPQQKGPRNTAPRLEVRQLGIQTGQERYHILQSARARLLLPTGLAVSGKALTYTLSGQVVLQTPESAESPTPPHRDSDPLEPHPPGRGPSCWWQFIFPGPPAPGCSAGLPLPSFPVTCRPPTSQSTENAEAPGVHSLSSPASLLQAYPAHPPPPTHPEEVASAPLSSPGIRRLCQLSPPPPKLHIVQAFTSILRWIFVQRPTGSGLSHQTPVPTPRLILLSPSLLWGHSSQKRSPNAPASRVFPPDSLSPINTSSSSFLSEPHLDVGVPQVP